MEWNQPIAEGSTKGNTNPPPKTPKPESVNKRDGELESIRRTLYNAIDKIERLQRQGLTTT